MFAVSDILINIQCILVILIMQDLIDKCVAEDMILNEFSACEIDIKTFK